MNNSRISLNSSRDAGVAVVVACRTQSSRLPKKALMPLHGIPSIERCLHNCLLMQKANKVILATTTEAEDAVLQEHTMGGLVYFWRGDRDDVIERYIGACEQYGVDTIIRVTGDCPVVSPEIADLLFNEHKIHSADYTAVKDCAIGSNSEIINVAALHRIRKLCGRAPYSEYMSWYLKNNPNLFKIHTVDLPSDLVRPYRLTLDYPEDLAMFDRLYQELDRRGDEPFLRRVFEVLDHRPDIVALNKEMPLKYRDDPAFIARLMKATRIAPPAHGEGEYS